MVMAVLAVEALMQAVVVRGGSGSGSGRGCGSGTCDSGNGSGRGSRW